VGEWLVHVASFPVFAFLIMVFGFGGGALSRLFGAGMFVLLGEISYSVYIIHQLVYRTYARFWLQSGSDADYIGFVLCIITILVISFLMWIAIEVPCRTWVKKRLRLRTAELNSAMAPAVSH
jgi:peptidoglycan/LPS O-acetylase OafA/YrhL